MLPVLSAKAQSIRSDQDWIGWELFGNRALRQGDWKIRSILKAAGGSGEWALFNLKDDPTEQRDLAQTEPAKLKVMTALWDQYAQQSGVILTGDEARIQTIAQRHGGRVKKRLRGASVIEVTGEQLDRRAVVEQFGR